MECKQRQVVETVKAEIDTLGIETDGQGWRAKAFLYCVEARCPESRWIVPLRPTLVISRRKVAIAELTPDPKEKRHIVKIRIGVTAAEMQNAQIGTIRRETKYGDADLVHQLDGVTYKTKISTVFDRWIRRRIS